jgi:hypothetical protein
MERAMIQDSDPRLTAYVLGELSEHDRRSLEAELARDEAGQRQLAEIQSAVAALCAELGAAPLPELEAERRQTVVETARGGRAQRRRRVLWSVASVGALAAIGLLFVTTLGAQRKPESSAVLAPSPPMAASVAPRSTEHVILEAPRLLVPEEPPPPTVDERPAPRRSPAFPQRDYFSSPMRPMVAAPVAPAGVKAGEWDDNANYREFTRWLSGVPAREAHRIDIRERRFIVVRDAAGRAVPACRVLVVDPSDRQTELVTAASGRAILFPHAEGLTGRTLTARATCGGGAERRFSLGDPDGVVDLRLPGPRALPAEQTIDVAFILDSTGSMSEEIAAVKSTIQKVAAGLQGSNVRVRVGLVEFKDRTDAYVTRVFPMSTDLAGFAERVADVSAGGGGDTPESGNEALHVAVHRLAWDDASFAKLAFLVGDAPPHLDYAQDYDYVIEAREAAHRGIQIYTVAASGMDTLGQVVWRQVAQYTGATNLFVLRGGAGPQSTGGGDPQSSCGGTQTAYTSGNLDELVLAKIHGAVRALERDPLRIPGVGTDENAKPCAERIVFAN